MCSLEVLLMVSACGLSFSFWVNFTVAAMRASGEALTSGTCHLLKLVCHCYSNCFWCRYNFGFWPWLLLLPLLLMTACSSTASLAFDDIWSLLLLILLPQLLYRACLCTASGATSTSDAIGAALLLLLMHSFCFWCKFCFLRRYCLLVCIAFWF